MTQLLDLDLSSGEWVAREVADIEQEYLGGLGVNSCLLYRWVPAGCDPLGPENILFFGAGPLVGTALPTACRTEATAKSPLSGRFGTTSAGAEFGARLKMTGFSYLAIRGESPEPVYLLLSPGRVELKKAGDLWGL
ncbi:MAG: aldehyde:ferredoxin oxidoreductase, partial [Clostridia bacterium]|nr:aldehyde:ferredoxin oxidoreductase [Clostridia bacterium]